MIDTSNKQISDQNWVFCIREQFVLEEFVQDQNIVCQTHCTQIATLYVFWLFLKLLQPSQTAAPQRK